MKTASDLLTALQRENVVHDSTYRHPYLHIAVYLSAFSQISAEEDREIELCRVLGWHVTELRYVLRHACLRLRTLAASEYNDHVRHLKERGHGWLSVGRADQAPPKSDTQSKPRIAHFYGVRGGQGRSSCIAFISRLLAEDGQRVLLVDADFEAPALDVLFYATGLQIEQTVLGINQGFIPMPACRVLSPTGGRVDLLAYRPDSPRYDLEAVSLSMHAAMDPLIINDIAVRIARYAKHLGYDSVLIDHRSGLSPYILPWLHALPGSLAFFSRMDWQWAGVLSFLPLLSTVGTQGVLVTADSRDGQSHRGQTYRILDAMSLSHDRSVCWPYDPAFHGEHPTVYEVKAETWKAALKLLQLLGLTESPQESQS